MPQYALSISTVGACGQSFPSSSLQHLFVSLFLEREVQEFRLEVRLLLISTALLGVHYLVLMTDTRERRPVNIRDWFGW